MHFVLSLAFYALAFPSIAFAIDYLGQLECRSSLNHVGEYVTTVMRDLLRDPSKEGIIREWYRRLGDRSAKNADNYGLVPGSPDFELRRTLLAFTKDFESREILKKAILADLKERSELWVRKIRASSEKDVLDMETQVFDLIVIGAGPHDAIFSRTLKARNPTLKMATLESSQTIGSNFDTEGFRLNSLNRQGSKGQISQKGIGNQNELPGGIIQIPDLSPEIYPSAQDLADVTLINRAVLPDAPVLFGMSVFRVEDALIEKARWPARYRITTSQGEIYADRIINSTGLGRELELKGLTKASSSLARTERAARKPGDRVTVGSVADFFRSVEANPGTLKEYTGTRGAVVGNGDSANTFLEYMMGFAPKDSYGTYRAQDGRVKEVVWFGQNKDDCDKFLNQTRPRYLDILGPLKANLIKPDADKITEIEKLPQGGYRLNGLVTVDWVVFATGFRDDSPTIYESILKADHSGPQYSEKNPFNESNSLTKIILKETSSFSPNGSLRDIAIGKVLTIGNSNITPQEIYFTAPAAGALVSEKDLRGVSANKVSLFNNGPRTEALATLIASRASATNLPRPDLRPKTIAIQKPFSSEGTAFLLPVLQAKKRKGSSLSDSVLFKSKSAVLLNRITLPISMPELTVRFNRIGDRWAVDFTPPLPSVAAEAFASEIARDPDYITLLDQMVPIGSPRNEVLLSGFYREGRLIRNDSNGSTVTLITQKSTRTASEMQVVEVDPSLSPLRLSRADELPIIPKEVEDRIAEKNLINTLLSQKTWDAEDLIVLSLITTPDDLSRILDLNPSRISPDLSIFEIEQALQGSFSEYESSFVIEKLKSDFGKLKPREDLRELRLGLYSRVQKISLQKRVEISGFPNFVDEWSYPFYNLALTLDEKSVSTPNGLKVSLDKILKLQGTYQDQNLRLIRLFTPKLISDRSPEGVKSILDTINELFLRWSSRDPPPALVTSNARFISQAYRILIDSKKLPKRLPLDVVGYQRPPEFYATLLEQKIGLKRPSFPLENALFPAAILDDLRLEEPKILPLWKALGVFREFDTPEKARAFVEQLFGRDEEFLFKGMATSKENDLRKKLVEMIGP